MTFQGHLKRRKMLLPMLTNSLDILENENNNSNRMDIEVLASERGELRIKHNKTFFPCIFFSVLS